MEAGKTLMMPLLAASLTTILAFMPLMLAPGAAGEYTRSISLVIAIALALSWVIALTVLLLVCIVFMKAGQAQNEDESYDRWYYNGYRGVLKGAIRFRWLVLLGAVGSMVFGGWLFGFVLATLLWNRRYETIEVATAGAGTGNL